MSYLKSSIGRKQVVALSGLGLILFVCAHFVGNFLLFLGPEPFNAYAKKMQSLGPLLWVMRGGLLLTFVIHISFTIMLVIENRRSRKKYQVYKPVGDRSFATRSMSLSGTLILIFVIVHLRDFTLADHHGIKSIIDGENLGLYGLVVNSFLEPIRSVFYVIAVLAVGGHVSHAFQSVFQTFGFFHECHTKKVVLASKALGLFLGLAFASIPIFLFIKYSG